MLDSTEYRAKDQGIYLNGTLMGKHMGLVHGKEVDMEYVRDSAGKIIDINDGDETNFGTLQLYLSAVYRMNDEAKRVTGDPTADLTRIPWVIVETMQPTITEPPRTRTLSPVRFPRFEEGILAGEKSKIVALDVMFVVAT